jgi:hypothetical protein
MHERFVFLMGLMCPLAEEGMTVKLGSLVPSGEARRPTSILFPCLSISSATLAFDNSNNEFRAILARKRREVCGLCERSGVQENF